jgi:hypothetical protein
LDFRFQAPCSENWFQGCFQIRAPQLLFAAGVSTWYIKTMKRLGKIAVCLAGGLAFNVGLCAPNPAATRIPPLSRAAAIPNPSPNLSINSTADNLLPEDPSSGDPYVAIADRNVFGLLPPTPPPAPEDPAKKNLPKITPEGIMGVFGNYRVLFKVAPAKADPNTKDQYYDLGEGMMQENIEVKKIDNTNSRVTFINHGVEQELLLAKAPSSSGPASPRGPVGPGGALSPGLASLLNAVRSEGRGDPGGGVNFGGGGRLGVHTSGEATASSNSGLPVSFGGAAQDSSLPPQLQNNLPADARVILMEAQRAQWQTTKNAALNPALIPPTPLTSLNKPNGEGDTGGGGVPAPPAPR